MLLSIHGPTVIRWLREASEQWNTDALAALSDTVASYPGSNTKYTPVPLQVQALVPHLEPTEAGFLLAAIHAGLSNDSHTGRWDPEFKDGFQSPHPTRSVTNLHMPVASSPSDANESEEPGAKLGETFTAEDLMQTVLEVQRCMSAKSVLKAFTATGEPGDGLQAVDRVADVHVVFQTYLETMNRYGIEPRCADFENTLEDLGAPIPEGSKGLNSLDYLMTI
jgi:hypothetical protein